MGTTKKTSIVKLVNSLHETSPYAYKTAPIFTAIIHNTPVDSLYQRMFCDLLQRIARFTQTKKKDASPSAATLPLLQLSHRCNSPSPSNLPQLQLSLRFKSPSASTLPPLQLYLQGNFPGITKYIPNLFSFHSCTVNSDVI